MGFIFTPHDSEHSNCPPLNNPTSSSLPHSLRFFSLISLWDLGCAGKVAGLQGAPGMRRSSGSLLWAALGFALQAPLDFGCLWAIASLQFLPSMTRVMGDGLSLILITVTASLYLPGLREWLRVEAWRASLSLEHPGTHTHTLGAQLALFWSCSPPLSPPPGAQLTWRVGYRALPVAPAWQLLGSLSSPILHTRQATCPEGDSVFPLMERLCSRILLVVSLTQPLVLNMGKGIN